MSRKLLSLVLLVLPISATAGEFSVKLEPGVALPLSAPQSEVFSVGGQQGIKALFGLTPYLDVGPSASFTLLPGSVEGAGAGHVWGLGAGLRLKRPHDAESFHGISPWLDADLLYVRTGALNRPGFDAAVGLAVPLGEARSFWLGPFIRYTHVLQGTRDGFDNRDAKLLSLGLSLELGEGARTQGVPLPVTEEASEVRTITRDVCPDSDGDAVPDSVDRCPEVAGTVENWGCPAYKTVVVKPDKLELKEKLYFKWDEATLEPASFPVLDEVVQALRDSKGSLVRIEGHADSSGAYDHNQTLSERRAAAVLQYLVAKGVPKERLVSKGFSSSVPRDTNATLAGRENNRRVEFVVFFTVLNVGSTN